ncbi:MAG: ATP-binding cassette domain-containing protein [Chloroflexota bacterium]
MIRAHGLRRVFRRLVAVDDVSLSVPDGTILALLGPNGAGKTTTVRLLAGLLAPTAGEATVAGWSIRSDPAAVRARIGLVTDSPGLHDQMTPVAYLDFFGRIYGLDRDTRRKRIAELLGVFGLHGFAGTRMAGFSRGMQQKVALARALLHEPSVVFLDEPTAGLDPLAARLVRELIVGLKQASRSIVLCTHDLDEAERLADHVAILSHGRLVASDTSARLRAAASRETLVQVTLAEPVPCTEAESIAARVVGVVEPSCEGTRLTYRTEQPECTNPRVIAALVGAGASIVSATCTTATLEDVYATALAAESIRAASATGGLRVAPRPVRPPPAAPDPEVVCSLPGDAQMTWLIARRAAVEALCDRLSLAMGFGFAVLVPILLVVVVVRSLELSAASRADPVFETSLAFNLLIVGLLPTVSAVGIASGQFAGEKERGILTPLLASPASNLAIFGGKVLGAILPAVAYSTVAEVVYVVGLGAALGPAAVSRLPVPLSLTLVALVPLVTCFAAIVSSLISSRVRTFNAAQQLGGLFLMPVWGIVISLAANLTNWGPAGLVAAVLGLGLIDLAMTVVGAATWRREEVLSSA